ncbi:MAG: cell division protein FtsZ [Bacteroidales bacterium]|nr:cell division protein FtsZ [Bacteroidales bacterium]
MSEDINIDITPANWNVDNSIIKVLGIGGGGCNAVSYMYDQGIEGCSFVVCNTDSQALQRSSVPTKIQMGRGLGAGTNPIKGRNAALESQDEIAAVILDDKTQMLFLTAGMGGGTGTGATPVIAKMAHDKGILTVAVVTLPFSNEGNEALARAIDGIHELERNVDSLLIINNEKLYEYFGDLLIHDALPKADEVLATAVKGIIEVIQKPGYINVDFEDVKTMMKNSGMALMGCGSGRGENRIVDAIREAFESPLLNDFDLKTAKNVLINITTGKNEKGLKMNDLSYINEKINEYTGGANNFKRGLILDENPEVDDEIHITAIATGFLFNNLIGPDINLGRIIMIDKDFVYDKEALSREEGLSLNADSSPHIGYNSDNVPGTFRYDPDRIPDLLIRDGQNISNLEMVPAIQRNKKN